MTDVEPKTPGSMTLGATWYIPRFVLEQLNGSIARVLVFDSALTLSERKKIINLLGSTYGIPV